MRRAGSAQLPGSFRDPSGFLFQQDGVIYRQVNLVYKDDNVPLSKIAGFLSGISHWLIIEFVPKSDSQVQRLLATREDIFPDYTRQAFEQEFSRYFTTDDSADIRESQRTLYLMCRVQR